MSLFNKEIPAFTRKARDSEINNCKGLLLRYKGDLSRGTTFYDSGPYRVNATLDAGMGGDNWGVSILPKSKALVLNGTSESAYLDNAVASHVTKIQWPLTVSAWIYMNDTGGTNVIFENDTWGFSVYTGFWLAVVNGRLQGTFGDGGGTGPTDRRTADSDIVISAGQWYHVAMIIAGITDFRFYVDGKRVGLNSTSGSGSSTIAYSVYPGAIGGDWQDNNFFFDGKIDDVKFYNRALSEAEIAEDYVKSYEDFLPFAFRGFAIEVVNNFPVEIYSTYFNEILNFPTEQLLDVEYLEQNNLPVEDLCDFISGDTRLNTFSSDFRIKRTIPKLNKKNLLSKGMIYWFYPQNLDFATGRVFDLTDYKRQGIITGATSRRFKAGPNFVGLDFTNSDTDRMTIGEINTKHVTVACWVYLTEERSNSYILANRQALAAGEGGVVISARSVSNEWRFSVDNGVSTGIANGSDPVNDLLRWVHVCGTYDGKFVRFYRNGILQAETAFTGDMADTGELFTFGSNSDQNNPTITTFQGYLSDALIYNRGLSGKEVLELYKESLNRYPSLLNEKIFYFSENIEQHNLPVEDLYNVNRKITKVISNFIPKFDKLKTLDKHLMLGMVDYGTNFVEYPKTAPNIKIENTVYPLPAGWDYVNEKGPFGKAICVKNNTLNTSHPIVMAGSSDSFFSGREEITISTWVNISTLPAVNGEEIALPRKTLIFNLGLVRTSGTQRLAFLVGTNGSSGWTTSAYATYTIPTNEWVLLTLRYKNGNGIDSFVNEKLINNYGATGQLNDNTNNITFGGSNGKNMRENNIIGPSFIWERSLTDTEIRSLYLGNIPRPKKERIYDFNFFMDEPIVDDNAIPIENLLGQPVSETGNLPIENLLGQPVSETGNLPIENLSNSVYETENLPTEDLSNKDFHCNKILDLEEGGDLLLEDCGFEIPIEILEPVGSSVSETGNLPIEDLSNQNFGDSLPVSNQGATIVDAFKNIPIENILLKNYINNLNLESTLSLANIINNLYIEFNSGILNNNNIPIENEGLISLDITGNIPIENISLFDININSNIENILNLSDSINALSVEFHSGIILDDQIALEKLVEICSTGQEQVQGSEFTIVQYTEPNTKKVTWKNLPLGSDGYYLPENSVPLMTFGGSDENGSFNLHSGVFIYSESTNDYDPRLLDVFLDASTITSGLDFSNTGTRPTIKRNDGGSFLTDGFLDDDYIVLRNAEDTGNNGNYLVYFNNGVTADTIEIFPQCVDDVNDFEDITLSSTFSNYTGDTSVTISGSNLKAGTNGWARIFDYDGSSNTPLTPIQTILPPTWDLTGVSWNGDEFGQGQALYGNDIIFSSSSLDFDSSGNSVTNLGGLFWYQRSGTLFYPKQLLDHSIGGAQSQPFSTNKGLAGSDEKIDFDGNTIVAGATWDRLDENGSNDLLRAGAAYVWVRNTGTDRFDEFQKIVPTGTNARHSTSEFGTCVALDNNTLVVSAEDHDYDYTGGGFLNNQGAVWIFKRSNPTGLFVQDQKITPTGCSGNYAGAFFNFGASLAIKDNILLIQNFTDYDENCINQGIDSQVFVYTRPDENSQFEQTNQRLYVEGGTPINAESNIGSQYINISSGDNGCWVVASARTDGYNETGSEFIAGAGATYIWKWENDQFVYKQKLVAKGLGQRYWDTGGDEDVRFGINCGFDCEDDRFDLLINTWNDLELDQNTGVYSCKYGGIFTYYLDYGLVEGGQSCFKNIPIEFDAATIIDFTGNLPVENISLLNSSLNIYAEELSGILYNNDLLTENLLKYQQNDSIPIELQGATTISTNENIPIEILESIVDSDNISIENKLGITFLAYKTLIENILSNNISNNTIIENKKNLDSVRNILIENISSLDFSSSFYSEILSGILQRDNILIENLIGYQQDNQIPIEVQGATIINAIKNIPIENLLGFLINNNIPNEYLSQLNNFITLQVEILASLNTINNLPGETTLNIINQLNTPIEYLSQLEDLKSIPTEYLSALLTLRSIPTEYLQSILNFVSIPIEAQGATIINAIKNMPIENTLLLNYINNLHIDSILALSNIVEGVYLEINSGILYGNDILNENLLGYSQSETIPTENILSLNLIDNNIPIVYYSGINTIINNIPIENLGGPFGGTGNQTGNPGTGISTTGCGTGVWTDLINITGDDNLFSTAIIGSGETSECLEVFDFPLDVPWCATILGIQASVKRKKNSGPGSLFDAEVRLRFDDNIKSNTNLASGELAWSTEETEILYGDVNDKWGEDTLSVSAINDPNFGIYISVTSSGGSGVAAIDNISIDVYYDLSTCEQDFTIPIENLSLFSNDYNLLVENIINLLSNNQLFSIEYLQSESINNSILLEILSDIAIGEIFPINYISIISSLFNSIPIEYLIKVGDTYNIPIENDGSVTISIIKSLPLEVLGYLSEDENIPIELRQLFRDSVKCLEWKLNSRLTEWVLCKRNQ